MWGIVIGGVGVGMVVARWIYNMGQGELTFAISVFVMLIGFLVTFASPRKKR